MVARDEATALAGDFWNISDRGTESDLSLVETLCSQRDFSVRVGPFRVEEQKCVRTLKIGARQHQIETMTH